MAESSDKDIRNAAMNEMLELARAIAEGNGVQSIATACKSAFDFYSGFVSAGFTEPQAMYLIVTLLKSAVGGNVV